jgi:hypothetical protein
VGKRDVAARMQARIVSGPYTSEHYGLIASDTARGLPGLLAEYLRPTRPHSEMDSPTLG